MYKLRKRFTTFNGSLIPEGKRWGITPDILNEFRDVFPEGAGCQTCIFVRLEGGSATDVFFETTGGHHETHAIDDRGWAYTTMYNPGSGHNEHVKGPWSVQAEGVPSEIVDDIGLPNGEHVTHWIVLTWQEGGEVDEGGPDPVEPPEGHVPHIQVVVDNVLVYEYGGPNG